MKKRDFDNKVKKLISNLSEYKKNKHWFLVYRWIKLDTLYFLNKELEIHLTYCKDNQIDELKKSLCLVLDRKMMDIEFTLVDRTIFTYFPMIYKIKILTELRSIVELL